MTVYIIFNEKVMKLQLMNECQLSKPKSTEYKPVELINPIQREGS